MPQLANKIFFCIFPYFSLSFISSWCFLNVSSSSWFQNFHFLSWTLIWANLTSLEERLVPLWPFLIKIFYLCFQWFSVVFLIKYQERIDKNSAQSISAHSLRSLLTDLFQRTRKAEYKFLWNDTDANFWKVFLNRVYREQHILDAL